MKPKEQREVAEVDEEVASAAHIGDTHLNLSRG